MGAQKTFDGQTSTAYEFDDDGGGAASNWKLTANGTRCAKPVDTDWIKISANCLCTTDESANVLRGGDSVVDAGVTVTMATGGHIKVQDRALTFDATAVLAFDGGTITFKHVATAKNFYVKMITGTVNAGTINLPSNSLGAACLRSTVAGTSWIGNSVAHRIKIDGSGGTSLGRVYFVYTHGSVYSYLEFMNLSYTTADGRGLLFDGVIFHDFPSGYDFMTLNSAVVCLRNCYFYNAGVSVTALRLSGSHVEIINTVFGKNEVGGASANGVDICNASFGRVSAINSIFASPTPVSFMANAVGSVMSNAHGQVKDAFKTWQGIGHTVESTSGGQTGNCVKFITSSGAADTDAARLRYLIGTIPAMHANTIDVTVYVKGTTGKTCYLRIDPDSIYGTTQEKAVAGSTDNWVQETIPQYTVNTGAGLKHAVPVYIDVTGATETWWADTLEATIG